MTHTIAKTLLQANQYFISLPVHKNWIGYSECHIPLNYHACPLSGHKYDRYILTPATEDPPAGFQSPSGFHKCDMTASICRQTGIAASLPVQTPHWLITDTMSAWTAGKAILWSEAFDWG